MIKGDLVLDAEFGVEGAIKEQLEIPETLWVLKNESGEMRVFVKKCSEEKCTSQNCPSALWLKQGEGAVLGFSEERIARKLASEVYRPAKTELVCAQREAFAKGLLGVIVLFELRGIIQATMHYVR